MMRPKLCSRSGVLVLFLACLTCPEIAAEGGPVVWSSYLGGAGWEDGRALSVGTDGSVYVGGSSDLASGLSDAEVNASFGDMGSWDAVVARISPDGSRLLWKAVLGGSGLDVLIGLDVDDRGIVTICGRASEGFPTTIDREHAGVQDAFVARLDPSLPAGNQLIWSTLLGGEGEEAAVDVALGDGGLVTVVGYTESTGFPTTPGALFEAYQGGWDLFIARLDPAPEDFDAQVLYSTYLGSTGHDINTGPDNGPPDLSARYGTIHMARAPDGTVLVATGSLSPGLPTTDNAFMKEHRNGEGNSAVYMSWLDPNAEGPEQLRYASYLSGGLWEQPQGLSVDEEGAILLLGHTWSNQFPVTDTAFDRVHAGNREGFFARLHPGLGLAYSTFLGGSGEDYSMDFVVLPEKRVLVATGTTSADFPLIAGAMQQVNGGGFDVALTLLDLNGGSDRFGQATYSTYFGGSGDEWFRRLVVSSDGSVVGAGPSSSQGLGTLGVFQPELAGSRDMFVAKLDLRVPTALFAAAPDTGSAPLKVALDASASTTPAGTALTDFAWNFGDGTAALGPTADHTFTEPGRFLVTLTVTNSVGLEGVAQRLISVGCPSGPLGPWSETDIGDPAFPGGARLDGDVLGLCAGGSRLSGSSDRFHFVHRKLDCDAFTFTARVQSAASDRNLAQVGLMVREGLEPGARHASLVIDRLVAGSQARFVSRSKTPGSTTNPSAHVPIAPPAAWLRIERRGDVLKAAVSADGATWDENTLTPVTIQGLSRTVQIGFAGMGDEPTASDAAFKPVQAAFGEIRIDEHCPIGTPFRRGFVNDDAALDIADPVSLLSHLFLGGEAPGCRDAADADDNGSLEITDPVALLSYLFLGGVAPAEPFSACGADPTPESPADVVCAEFSQCP